MYVRLAFAVQACMEPDILIVDEALSVGDFFFQQKCLARMRELRKRQVTLLFVSHDMGIVRDLCDESVYLREGRLVFFGDSRKAVRLYFQESTDTCRAHEDSAPAAVSERGDLPAEFREGAIWLNGCTTPVSGVRAEILAVTVIDSGGRSTMKAGIGDTLRFRMLFRSHTREPLHASFTLKNRYDQVVYCSGSYICSVPPLRLDSGATAVFEFELQCMVEAGMYSFSFNLSFEGDRPNRGVNIHDTPWLGPLAVEWDYNSRKAPFLGMFNIPGTCRFYRAGSPSGAAEAGQGR
jgi:lipopolysaccharide transport system ATP-binding protein